MSKAVFATIVGIVAVLFLLILLYSIYRGGAFVQPQHNAVASPFPSVMNTNGGVSTLPSTDKPRVVPQGFKEYRNKTFHFSLLYPEYLEVKEYSDNTRWITVTFQNVTKKVGFQIFIVPFYEKQISQERFKRDAPSGVRKDMQNIIIDGALGASFKGFDTTLGDTSEIWFLKDGLLYEASTMLQSEPLLKESMGTWKFI